LVDLTTREGAVALFQELPRVDILVNNLGIYEPKRFEEIPDEEWFDLFNVNVMSGVRLARYYLPDMLRKDWGRIIFVSSEAALVVPPELIHYSATKAAQLAISRGLAELTKGTGVTVNTVIPGPKESLSSLQKWPRTRTPRRRKRRKNSSKNIARRLCCND
jgi:NAD(P)-dependent dehydrogenase (short-subunit alcohol dehydrogenase family)